VHFTREPLTETIITPREGYKLLLRAVGECQEEYVVDSVEVVTFGACWFFRSLEKPRVFLLPMLGYEIVEIQETRTVLKKPQVGKTIKIGAKKKDVLKAVKAKEKEEEEEEEEESPPREEAKRQAKKWTRARRSKIGKGEVVPEPKDEEGASGMKKSEPIRRTTLLPPPTSLISEQIDRYKHHLVEHGAFLPPDEGGAVEGNPEEPSATVEEDLSTPFNEGISPQPSVSSETDKGRLVDFNEET